MSRASAPLLGQTWFLPACGGLAILVALTLAELDRLRSLRETVATVDATSQLAADLAALRSIQENAIRRLRLAELRDAAIENESIIRSAADQYARDAPVLLDRFREDLAGLAGRPLARQTREDLERLRPLVQSLSDAVAAQQDAFAQRAAQTASLAEPAVAGWPSNEDPSDTVSPANRPAGVYFAMERHHRQVLDRLRLADALVWQAFRREARRHEQNSYVFPWWRPGLALVGLALVFLGFLVPWLRLVRLIERGATSGDRVPQSREEAALATERAERAEAVDRYEADLTRERQARQRAEQAARRLELELATFRLYHENLINSLRTAIVVTTSELVITYANRAARDLLSPLSADPKRLELPATGTDSLGLLVNVARDPSLVHQILHEHRSIHRAAVPTAHGRLLDVTVTPDFDETGKARGLLWVLDDVTESVDTKRRLIESERLAAVGRLSAQVAHEIRNPLSAIGLNAELVEEELRSESPMRVHLVRQLEQIAREIERLTDVTETYLRLARLPAPRPSSVFIPDAVHDVVAMVHEELKARSITVTLAFAPDAENAWTDPGHFRQALLNVIRNAAEAMPQGGQVVVATTRLSDRRVAVDVVDEGVGIASDHFDRIFEPFFSLKPEGTGLGLSITRQMLRENHGDIRVLRSTKGGGTVLRIELLIGNPEPTLADDEPILS